MIQKIPIGQLRATIFVAPIVYDSKNLSRIQELLDTEDEYVPRVQMNDGISPIIPTPQGPQTLSLDWEMVSSKKNCIIHFGPQKIDIIKNTFAEGESSEDDFCKYASDILVSIMVKFRMEASRIAYAPVYVPDWTKEFTRTLFNKEVYAKNKFKDSELSNLLFKQAYRVIETVNNSEITLNYVAEASEGQNIVHDAKNNSVTIKQMLNLSLDINSVVGKNYHFNQIDVKSFFINATEYAKAFLAYYIQ